MKDEDRAPGTQTLREKKNKSDDEDAVQDTTRERTYMPILGDEKSDEEDDDAAQTGSSADEEDSTGKLTPERAGGDQHNQISSQLHFSFMKVCILFLYIF